jgi:hypothetical protein
LSFLLPLTLLRSCAVGRNEYRSQLAPEFFDNLAFVDYDGLSRAVLRWLVN